MNKNSVFSNTPRCQLVGHLPPWKLVEILLSLYRNSCFDKVHKSESAVHQLKYGCAMIMGLYGVLIYVLISQHFTNGLTTIFSSTNNACLIFKTKSDIVCLSLFSTCNPTSFFIICLYKVTKSSCTQPIFRSIQSVLYSPQIHSPGMAG